MGWDTWHERLWVVETGGWSGLAKGSGVAGEGRYAISVDVGGTFTDFVLFDLDSGSTVAFHKVLTDADRPARAVIQGWTELLEIGGVRSRQVEHAVHSTTLVTNAIVERRGAMTALLTTQGFRDVLEIGIEQIYDIYDLFAPYPEPLIPRKLRIDVPERIDRDGHVVEPLDEDTVRAIVSDLVKQGVESIAVSLVHSYRNPAHERRIGEIINEEFPALTVSLSSRVAPLIGEYERTSTVAADAYVKPILQRYIADLISQLCELGFQRSLYMMLSSGGISTAEAAMEFPIRLLESGPAAGGFAAGFYGELVGQRDLLSLDMGGTTAKACLIEDGQPDVAHMLEADRAHRFMPGSGLPILTPTVDLIEIGAGGGSIAHINTLGLLNVGPQSAGSDPGPVSYRRDGCEPTVTDANLVLGYLDPDYFLGGRMSLDRDGAEAAIGEKNAVPLGIDKVEAAWGIHSIVNENMARAARTHIIERNRDPRNLSVVAFGGAGPAHAAAVAKILGMGEVIVPLGAGVASAIGALTAPMALPFARSYMTLLKQCDWSQVERLYADMTAEATAALSSAGNLNGNVRYVMAADMRFNGQYHELRVDLPDGALNQTAVPTIETAFHARYTEVYGRIPPGMEVEVLNWHFIAEAPGAPFNLAEQPEQSIDINAALKGERKVYFRDPEPGYRLCQVYDRYQLRPGMMLNGPCIIEEPESTIVVPPGSLARVDQYLNVVINIPDRE
jgi:N-methylhydantoinase A/oxoprolinase/acetone carboxylase beta subunit